MMMLLRCQSVDVWSRWLSCGCAVRVGPLELHPGPAIAALMKLSFDEQHRQAICALGLTSSPATRPIQYTTNWHDISVQLVH